ncbi:dipeptidase 1-like [Macrosteles quadrilineatus]|uniref:dipeptidase 1-like n=1 Tax=Macrosteles quadrilineatus TaxID=74068 RepID=UPI0023E0C9B8|nr:dipeptidase 1-like [Macrosteles quadrilineatus]
MRGYDDYPPQQETVFDSRLPFRSPQEAYYKRPHRPRRYSAGADYGRQIYRTFSDDQKMLIHAGVQVPAEVYPYPDTRYYGSMPRRPRKQCPEDCVTMGVCEAPPCCCEDEWYSRGGGGFYPSDIPPCPPAPTISNPALYREPPSQPRSYRDPPRSQTPTRYTQVHTPTRPSRAQTPTRTHVYRDRSMSRSSSRELKMNGHGNAPYCQRGRTPRDDTDSEEDIVMTAPLAAECHCACDHIINGSYRQLKEEDSTQFPPDVTQPNKEEVTFYPRHPPSTTSTSTTTGCMLLVDLFSSGRARHRWLVGAAVLLAAAAGVGVPLALSIQSGASYEERLEMAHKLLKETPLIDGHNDLPWNIRKFVHNRLNEFRFGEDLRQVPPWSLSAWSHTDLKRLRAGHVSAQFWAAYVPCESQFKDAVQLTLEQIDVIKRLTDKYSPPLTYCTSAKEISDAHAKGGMCSLIGVEGGHSLANSLPVLRVLYSLGVRYLTLTSTCNTQWADSSLVELPGKKAQHGGLTNFGKIIVKEMNRLGMIVDLSHVSLATMKAALEVSKAPVVFSHSSARALCNSSRNVPDNILASLGLNGGLVMVNFYSQFLTCKDTATVSDAAAHINHIRNIAGVDSVGLGAGYDGINFTPKGLEDVSSYPALFAELIGSGLWQLEDLKKLAGLNFLRVMKQVEKVRDDMAKSGVEPYEDTISPRYLKGRTNCTSQDPF